MYVPLYLITMGDIVCTVYHDTFKHYFKSYRYFCTYIIVKKYDYKYGLQYCELIDSCIVNIIRAANDFMKLMQKSLSEK